MNRTLGAVILLLFLAVSGIVSVDLDLLHREDESPAPNSRLLAQVPEAGEKEPIQAAELLTLDTASLQDVEVAL